jgi:heme/copper-type cytochrome/quinol oxidase subunit 4
MYAPELYRMLWRYWIDLVGNKTGFILSVTLSVITLIVLSIKCLTLGVPWYWVLAVPLIYMAGWLDYYLLLTSREKKENGLQILR